MKQSLIAVIESGNRQATEGTRAKLDAALEVRPSLLVDATREDLRRTAEECGATNLRLFGSVARRSDSAESDVDLVATDDDRLRRRLGDLRVLVADAAHLTSKGWEAYVADTPDGRLLRAAGEHLIIQVATVAEKLPQEFKDRYPAAEWVKLGRMRNLAAHHCDLVDNSIVWRALTHRIPGLAALLELDRLLG